METLVTTDWLSRHLGDPDLVVLDCTVHTDMTDDGSPLNKSGEANYERGHIPGAGFADLTTDEICDEDSPYEFAVPTVEKFCLAMGNLGIGDETRVVLYDGFLSGWAAWVWWMLRRVGFDNAAILDGGPNIWITEGHPLSTKPASPPARKLTPRERPSIVADREEVLATIDDDTLTLIDTMPDVYYRGEQSIYARPGHIKGAINLSGIDLLDERGCYKPQDQLAAMHAGLDKNARVITYCGGGIMASSNAFIMTRLGFSDVAVYTASLEEWAADPGNPMVMGAQPG